MVTRFLLPKLNQTFRNMNRLPYLITLTLSLTLLSCQHKSSPVKIDHTWKKIPAGWIEKLQKFDYKKPDTTLLTEFGNIIKPDTINNPHPQHVREDYGFIFNPIFVDLDGDHRNEILCLQGWDVSIPYMCIFKQVDNDWYLIYKEEINTFYGSPTLYVANSFSKNKTFYLKRVYDHGSGVYIDGYTFYKLVDNKVYQCLNIINDAHIYGWALFMNQSAKSAFEFRGDSEDNLYVNYSYNFFPGSVNKGDFSWDAHEDIPLIKGEDNVSYVYNAKEHKYKLEISNYNNDPTSLTPEKIACFGDFGNDSLIVKAYRRHIDTLLKIGTPIQKKLLRTYIALATKNKTVTTEILEMKSKRGGTTFYGPRKK
jgi:hypothetical protein